jgi:YHS domain-containing protein
MNASKIILSTITVALAFGFVGCKKKEQLAVPAKEMSMKDMQMQTAKTANDTNSAVTQAAASTEQTLCPVTGDKIDKNIFVEYKGKKVYFCCAACKGPFEKNPEKYMAKLPQFQK